MLVKNLSCRLPFNTCCTSNKCGKDLKCEIDDKTKNKLKENIKSEMKEDIKNELKKDLKCETCEIDDKTKSEMKENIKSELKENIKNELKKDLKYEIDDKTKGEMKENIKNELKKDLKYEIDDKTKSEMKENIKNELKKDLKCETCEIDDKTKGEMKENIKNELKKDLKYEIDDKTKSEMKENIKNELKKDLKCETCEIDDKTKNKLKENIKNELKKDLKCETCEIDDKTKGEMKENIKNELKKDLKCETCEIDDKTKGEMKENIKNELKKDLKCETCEIDDKTKNELKKNIKSELEKDLKCKCTKEETTKEVDESGCDRRGCKNAREDGEYVNVGSDANLYIRKALDKFYPDLSAEIIDKIKAGDYYVEQFGIKVTNCDKNGTDYSYITSRGSMDSRCVTIPSSDLCKESYDIRQDVKGDWYENCKNRIFDDNAHVVSAKVYQYSGSINKNKPVAVLSQNQPLIIADKKTHKLVKKDGTISDKTLDECKEFFDSDQRITSCAEEKRDCEVCKETIWDFQDVVPAFFI